MKNSKVRYGLTLLKFLYPVLFSLLSIETTKTIKYSVLFAVEAVLWFLILNLIAKKSEILSWLLGVVALFVVYAQAVVLNFAGTYLQMIMLTNLDSLSALGGKMVIYGSAVIGSIIVLLLPIKYIPIKTDWKKKALLYVGAFAIGGVLVVAKKQYSPTENAARLFVEAMERRATQKRVQALIGENNIEISEAFYSKSVGDGISRPDVLPENPNVVLILTEGLSRNVVDDSRDIMPNVARYASEGISFYNYYDHTAATYRGIIGQLYSAHQFDNSETNSLISIQSILKGYGYETTFVNAEPENVEFTNYLNGLGFDSVESGKITDRWLNDGETYDEVFRRLDEGEASGNPQFITVYTFGTHVSFDSDEEKYKDGKNRLLNRFYNADYQFGRFMEKLKANGYDENTIVIFTADHASYVDDDYTATFIPKYERPDVFCDTIPLVIWYKGVEHQEIDAEGRNSLALAPTILDYLDKDAENFFLGTSLYLPMRDSLIETTFCVPDCDWYARTDNGIRELTDEEKAIFRDVLERYLALTNRNETPVP